VIAAANPIGGVYKTNMNFNDNVELTDPILSRFDILTVIKDEPSDYVDDALATFVLNSHMKSHPKIRQLEKDSVTEEERSEVLEFLSANLLDESQIKQTDPNF
jgi:DNA replication licensing factor MCM2